MTRLEMVPEASRKETCRLLAVPLTSLTQRTTEL